MFDIKRHRRALQRGLSILLDQVQSEGANSRLLTDESRVRLFLAQQAEMVNRLNSDNPFSNEQVNWNPGVTDRVHIDALYPDPVVMMRRQLEALGLTDWTPVLRPKMEKTREGLTYDVVFPFQADLMTIWKCKSYQELGEVFLRKFREGVGAYSLSPQKPELIHLDPSEVEWDPYFGQRWQELEDSSSPDPDLIRFHRVPLDRVFRCHSARNARRKAQLKGYLAVDYIQFGCAMLGLPEILEKNIQSKINCIGNRGMHLREASAPLFSRGDDGVSLSLRREDYICIFSDCAVI